MADYTNEHPFPTQIKPWTDPNQWQSLVPQQQQPQYYQQQQTPDQQTPMQQNWGNYQPYYQGGQQGQQQQGGNPFSSGMTPEQVRSGVEQYYAGRGVTPYPTSVDYWTNRYNDFGNRDPEYFMRYLSNAEEFTGGPQQTAQAMWGGGGGGSGAYIPGQGVPGMGTALGGQWGQRANSLYDLLMQRAGQSLNIDRNDPIIRNQSDNYAAMQERAMRNYLGNVAEQSGPNANISAERRSAAEKQAQATSGFEAQLMGNELGARRGEIAQALSGAQGFLTNQQQMALQELLGQLGLAQQAYQFDQGQQYAYSPFGGGY